jgi:site-specific recombinase XerC
MKLEDALSAFLVQLDADGRSAHTIGQYERHVRVLGAWLAANGFGDDLGVVTPGVLALFMTSPQARTRSDGRAKRLTSTNTLRTSLRCFFGYLAASGAIGSNPARLLRRAQ